MASSLTRAMRQMDGEEEEEAAIQCVVGDGRWRWPLFAFCYLQGLGGLVVGGLCLYAGSLLIERGGGDLLKGLFLLLYGPASFCAAILFLVSINLKRPSLAKPFVLLLLFDFFMGFVDAFLRTHWTTFPAMLVVFVCIVCADGLRQKMISEADAASARTAAVRAGLLWPGAKEAEAGSALLFRPRRGPSGWLRRLGLSPRLPTITVTAPADDDADDDAERSE